jgi:2-polyprenyl-3-methyl-5-hydroxy-6-metoxy-1,4-benzoquinol methylase
MNIDILNNEYYNTFTNVFDNIPFEDVLLELFSKNVPKAKSEILEIGSGPGALAVWIESQGHKVTCIEPAEKPAEKARERNLKVFQMRFQDYHADQKFDSVVAISSLIHIPLLEMPRQINRISELLNPEGVAFFSFIEGEGESCEDPTRKGKNRFFSKFTENELDDLLLPYFLFIEKRKIEVKIMNKIFFLFVLKKHRNSQAIHK